MTMRLGEPATPVPMARMDPAAKGAALALAPNVPDGPAEDMYDLAMATNYGGRQRLICYGIGALGGAVLGIVAAKLLRI